VIEDLGWGGDHGGKLIALQAAIKHLSGSGKVRDRLANATFCLVTYSERDFPEPLRPAFTRILEARLRSRREINPNYVVFAFDELTPTERKQIVADITSLHDACLIDSGRKWPEYDFMYPKDEVLQGAKRTRKRAKAIRRK